MFHDQTNGQVAAVIHAQPGDGGVQVCHFVQRAQERAVDDFNQPRRQRGIATDDFAEVADADFRVFRCLANI